MAESSSSLPVTASIGLVKSIACIYDIVSLPVYAVIQRPWSKTRASSEPKAIQENPNDPYSPWVRIGNPPDHLCFKASSIAELFAATCQSYLKSKCFGYRQVLGEEDEKQADGKVFKKQILGDYIWFSYEQIDLRVINIAKGLMLNGVKPGDVVLILAETRLDWMLAAQAVFRLGATIATLYSTLGDEAIVYGINETGVSHIITSHDLIPKIGKFQPKLPNVRTVIYFEGLKSPDTSDIQDITFIPFKVVEDKGHSSTKTLKFSPPKADDPAIIMYTSGSTGIPKGVVLTHRNVLTTIGGFFAVAHSLGGKATYMAYLPLAHVLELAAEMFFFSIGVSIGYSSPHTMTDKSTAIKKGQSGDAVLLKPTVMAAVPLVLDRIRKGINDQMASKGAFMRSLFNFLVDYKKYWIRKGYNTPIVNAIVSKKIRAMLGGNITHIVAGSAPLSPDTMEFIRCCLDVTVIQGYGLTETAAGSSLMDLTDMSTGRVGPPLFGCKIKLVDWREGNYFVTDKPYPRGEIVVGGGCVASGYYLNDDLTAESFRHEDGVRWFYTGDIGEIHPDGSIKIIDRKKDLVKLQFGEYISLGKVETELKSCPIVDNICIYGDSYHNYIVAIVVPQAKALATIAKNLGKDHLSFEQLCRDPLVQKEVLGAISEHGSKARLHKNEIPAKVLLVSDEWSPDSGLVTAALKIRRKNVNDRYKLDINRLYGIRETGMST